MKLYDCQRLSDDVLMSEDKFLSRKRRLGNIIKHTPSSFMKLSVHITKPLLMYDYYLLHVLLLHNCAILARQRFARMSFFTQ